MAAPAGGVLFHCMGGRDRTGMIAMLLLAAADAEPAGIIDDYLESVRNGGAIARAAGRPDSELAAAEVCRAHGTSTGGAFRLALQGLSLATVLDRGALGAPERTALETWRGALGPGGPG